MTDEAVQDASQESVYPPADVQSAAVDRGVAGEEIAREVDGLSVGDGFRFGCGFVLAMTIGVLALLILLTAFVAVGAMLGIKIPIFG
jgi:hypothetical protein